MQPISNLFMMTKKITNALATIRRAVQIKLACLSKSEPRMDYNH